MKRGPTDIGDAPEIVCFFCEAGPLQEWRVKEYAAKGADCPAVTYYSCIPCEQHYKKQRGDPGHPCYKAEDKDNDNDKGNDTDKDQEQKANKNTMIDIVVA